VLVTATLSLLRGVVTQSVYTQGELSDVTESMVTIRSPCCGYNLAWCVELKGEDLWSYSPKTKSVSLQLYRRTFVPCCTAESKRRVAEIKS